MKNLRRILLTITMLFVVVLTAACSKKDEYATKVFYLEKNGLKTTITYTYDEKEDKIIKQETKNEGIYSEFRPGSSKEDVQKLLDPIAAKYQGITGLKESIEYQDDKFIETLEVDYENIDFEKAKTVFGPSFQDPKKVRVSMKKTEDSLTKAGYTVK